MFGIATVWDHCSRAFQEIHHAEVKFTPLVDQPNALKTQENQMCKYLHNNMIIWNVTSTDQPDYTVNDGYRLLLPAAMKIIMLLSFMDLPAGCWLSSLCCVQVQRFCPDTGDDLCCWLFFRNGFCVYVCFSLSSESKPQIYRGQTLATTV